VRALGESIADVFCMQVVIAEDSPVYRALMKSHFEEWGIDTIFASDGGEAWNLLHHSTVPTLALLDWVLPGLDGIELCRKIRSDFAAKQYIYAILVTAKDTKRDLVDAMNAGADDYLVKPFYAPELKARVMAAKRILDLQATLLEAQESLRFAARHDALTALNNRPEIIRLLSEEINRTRTTDSPISVIFADIDRFKSINDSLGHLAGDKVLKVVSQRLLFGTRAYDHVGRYGGEEFVIVLPGCDRDSALARADELLRAIREEPIAINGKNRTVTASMGVACFSSDRPVSVEELLRLADVALYRAKSNGRNRVEVADAAAANPDQSLTRHDFRDTRPAETRSRLIQ
jgi:two-component system, cell cycle response regulator